MAVSGHNPIKPHGYPKLEENHQLFHAGEVFLFPTGEDGNGPFITVESRSICELKEQFSCFKHCSLNRWCSNRWCSRSIDGEKRILPDCAKEGLYFSISE